MNDFCRKLITEWRRLELPFAGETFLIAVSGGADSCALVGALHELRQRKKLDLRFVVAHFDHNLRGKAGSDDALFVGRLAARFDLEFVTEKGDIPKSGNLEQNARRARYAFLADKAEALKARGVLTAHTLNDQAETFLINLIRGSGVEGLSAMRPIRKLTVEKETADERAFETLLIRPLLSWAKREDTEIFCKQNEIEFRFDKMNDDLRFQRVRVRKVLLPLLRDFNPKIVENLAKTADLLRQENSLRDYDAERFSRSGSIAVKELIEMPKPVLYKTLRMWLKSNRGDLRQLKLKHIEAIERLLFSRRSGKTAELPKGERVIKSGGKLHFQKTKVEK